MRISYTEELWQVSSVTQFTNEHSHKCVSTYIIHMYVLEGVDGWAGRVDSIGGLWVRGEISEGGTNAIYVR
jgi:hypothetical protein